MKTSIVTLFLLSPMLAWGAATNILIDSGDKSLENIDGLRLSAGSSTVDRDGALVLVGYFPGATTTAPFGFGAGNFTALVGMGTPFGIDITIGDASANGAFDGELFTDFYSILTGVADQLFPTVDTPLVVRIFNRNNPTASSWYMDLSNTEGSWNWKAPRLPESIITFDMGKSGLVIRATDGLDGFFNPIPVPVTSKAIAGYPVLQALADGANYETNASLLGSVAVASRSSRCVYYFKYRFRRQIVARL